MKRILLLFILLSLASCASSKVCGGSGGKRCVDVSVKMDLKTIS